MATRRQGRAGFFGGASRAGRRASGAPGAPLAGVTYVLDCASDTLTWGPHAARAFGLAPADLPATGRAFARLAEPGGGPFRDEVIAGQGYGEASGETLGKRLGGSYDTRYALRFGADRVVMVQDAGRWQPDGEGRPALLRGQLRLDPSASAPELLPAAVRARSELLCQIQHAINEALRLSHTCTLIAGACADDGSGMDRLGARLRPMMRRHDRFAALGPGRFVLTLTNCSAGEAVQAMARLARLLEGSIFEGSDSEGSDSGASLHLGAACSPDHTFQAVKLLRFAEQALDEGIACGQRARLHESLYGSAVPAAAQPAVDVVAALNERRLVLACRPVADAQSRAPALLQAAAALPGPGGRPVPLGPLPALEDANLSLLVDGRMLELAADRLAADPEARLILPVARATLLDAEWLPLLAAHLGARPGIGSRLLIEVPETALGTARAWGRLDAMRAVGIGIVLSGFGVGHAIGDAMGDASLTAGRSLPVDLLKIDGVFIQPLGRSTDDRLFVRRLVGMAQRLGVATAAEWVDDERTARLLADWGVDYLEGSLFGELTVPDRPSAVHETERRARRA